MVNNFPGAWYIPCFLNCASIGTSMKIFIILCLVSFLLTDNERRTGMLRTTGSVVLQLNTMELLTRYSMNAGGRSNSNISSLTVYRELEAEQLSGKQWNWKYLRRQFKNQENIDELYKQYDDKLRETLGFIYLSLLIVFSTIHILLVVIGTHMQDFQWHSTFLSLGIYVIRIAIPTLLLWKGFYEPLKEKWFWIPIFVTIIITTVLVVTDITVAIYSSENEGLNLRPAYATMTLLSIYIFLPMRNNYLAIFLGLLVSLVYVLIYTFYTYIEDPQTGAVVKVASDFIYLIGVNLMGIYFRLMNEIVTRRSFLDRRACIVSTLRLKFVKDQEERLMSSILPEHIVSRVRQDIRDMFLGIKNQSLSESMRTFNQLYVEEHDNVSILYADVVNYTMISTTLSAMRMVELLNELFGRFDDASEELDVLRIKFLGDCYYCVSGIPKPTELHAKNCVDLGLEMIHIIKDVREKNSLNIDMRIGVHSGRILSGLIGIRKWQYDIWSKDATIASKMESTGRAGKVHITGQTLELILDFAPEYIFEANFESQNDPFIMKNRLQTYLISGYSENFMYRLFVRNSLRLKVHKHASRRRSEGRNSANYRRTTKFMDANLVEYRLMLTRADQQMAKEIKEMTNSRGQIQKETRLSRFTLMFTNVEMEKKFMLLPDPLFKYYILCCFVISVLILLMNGLTTNWFRGFPWYTWTVFGFFILGLIILQPLTWFQFLWLKYQGIKEPKNDFLRKIYDTSVAIVKSAKIRTVIYFLISLGLAATSIVNVIACSESEVEGESVKSLSNCISSWHVTQCWGLALLLNFLFSRVFYIFKWIVAGALTTFYLWVVWDMKTTLFAVGSTWNVGLDPRTSHTLSVVFITITLYWIDRTTEFRNRLDYLWQVQLTKEQEEAETMLQVNKMLLENILPAHVVQVYLDLNRSVEELYYENYDNVAVMFASLTDYKLGVKDDDDLSDKTVLSILDQVVSDFDKLLLVGESEHKIEKIKMAGWTYMAACGLDPNRENSGDSTSYSSVVDNRQNTPYHRAIVITMVEFAATMMMQLRNFNKGSFQSFEGLNLRIGISHGEVAAGVVGSIKPLYDIWGHAVNMASRMDSTGERSKIQVTENTAKILDESGILTTYRGETFVKGAGYIKTFFVPIDENFSLIKKEDSADYYRVEDRSRYYHLQNTVFNELDNSNSINQYHTYGVRDMSIYDEDIDDNRSIASASPNDNKSHVSSEPSISDTQC